MRLVAFYLFNLAVSAYRSCDGPEDLTGDQSNAIVSVLFAVASLEAFLNELAGTATGSNVSPWLSGPPSISVFSELMKELEERRASIESKMFLAKWILSGEPYDKGKNPYQDFALLVKLRNTIVHPRPLGSIVSSQKENDSSRPPEIVQVLQSRKLAAPLGFVGAWLSAISTRAVAKWACNSSAAMALSLIESIPECQFC